MGIFWGLNSLRDPNLGCGAGVSHDPDPGLSMIQNRDLPRSGAGHSRWWNSQFVPFFRVVWMEGTPWDAQSGIGRAHHSLEFSAHIPVIFHGKPRWWQTCSHFFPLGTKPLDRDTPPFTPPGAPGTAPGNEGIPFPKSCRQE